VIAAIDVVSRFPVVKLVMDAVVNEPVNWGYCDAHAGLDTRFSGDLSLDAKCLDYASTGGV
jgi:hypothetical protein